MSASRTASAARRPPIRLWSRGGYEISTDPARLDLRFIHRELSRSYWAKGISRALVKKAFGHSLVVFGLYRRDGRQVGCARLVSDGVRFAYLMDVLVTESERGTGLGTWLNERIVAHPDLRGVRGWMLATKDAHALYRKVGWKPLTGPRRYMVRKALASRTGAARART